MTTDTLRGQIALVTGAGSGIGSAITAALVAEGACVWLAGRDRAKLEATCGTLRPGASRAHPCDLALDDDIARLAEAVERESGRLDILVHSAGTIALGAIESLQIEDFDRQYRVNARAPLLLTQRLLPLLKRSHGQVVFINSSVGLRVKEHVAAYAASKHALKAIADTLRAEVNDAEVRVLSVYPGNTASPMQETIAAYTGRTLPLEVLLQPQDVAEVVLRALLLPRSAEATDIHVRPFRKPH